VFPVPFPIPVGRPGDSSKLDDARDEIRALKGALSDLHRRLEKQAVLVRALFALLCAKQGLTEAELLDHFRRAEAERASAQAKKCPECGRAVNLRTLRCLYCGAACPIDSAFELLELGAWQQQSGQVANFREGSDEGNTLTR
jgi:ferredoxin